jgi:hypothetical protein
VNVASVRKVDTPIVMTLAKLKWRANITRRRTARRMVELLY